MIDVIEQIGAFAGLAAFLGLAVLALLSFAHGRDIRRLRDWAGSAPEREAERKESTSAIAAQRAEELRALEEARTAEHEAVESREMRRQRREEGLPELTRGERVGERFSGFGERLSPAAGPGRGLRRRRPDRRRRRLRGHLGRRQASAKGGNGSAKQRRRRRSSRAKSKSRCSTAPAVAGLAATYGEKVEDKGFEARRRHQHAEQPSKAPW